MGIRIALDAGHGMNTAGKRCLKSIDSNETREWYLNQRIASKVEAKLKDYEGVEVIRVDDSTGKTDVTRADRCISANKWNADIYCSFHHNAGAKGGNAGGLVVFTYDDSKESIELRNTLYDCLIENDGIKGNRVTPKLKEPSFEVLNSTKMIAVLVEHGFMDSKVDTPIILTEEFAESQANGWIRFFERYYGIKKKSTGQSNVQVPKINKSEGYLVKVIASNLNIRSNPGIGKASKIVGVISDKGVYTIVEERNVSGVMWGKLKSRIGWISLKYTKKL